MPSVIRNIEHANDNWKDAKVREGGSIVVANGTRDMVTKSARISEEYKQNPQMRVLDLPGAYHMTPQLEADTVIPRIFEKQE